MIKRTTNFIEAAFFLSKFGQTEPPVGLGASSWKEAYHMFYDQLNEGRAISAFEHSLKNARDAFDGYFHGTKREGWKYKNGQPNKLSGGSLEVFNKLTGLSEEEVWKRISRFANLQTKNYENVFEDLIAIEESEKVCSMSRTEVGVKVVVSRKIERNPALRKEALRIHGFECKVCGFNYEKIYGIWGKDWAEVHHLSPISESKEHKVQTDPSKDLVVVCANCHRMIHRKNGITLTIDELKAKIRTGFVSNQL